MFHVSLSVKSTEPTNIFKLGQSCASCKPDKCDLETNNRNYLPSSKDKYCMDCNVILSNNKEATSLHPKMFN